MTPRQTEGPPPWRVAVAFGILGMLAVGVCAESRNPSLVESAAEPTATSDPSPTAAPALSSEPVTEPGGTTVVATTAEPASTDSAAITLPGDVFADTQAALTAWGEFAATYDLASIEDTFVLDGPQYDQLAGEAAEQADAAPGPPPFQFLLAFPQVIVTEGNEVATVRTTVVIARAGEVDREVAWDIEMHWVEEESRWRLFKATASPE